MCRLNILTVSCNEPKFRENVSWNQTGITIGNIDAKGSRSGGIFINRKNTLYVVDRYKSCAYIWFDGNTSPGMPNPNFQNQEFSEKNQESIRRFFMKSQRLSNDILTD